MPSKPHGGRGDQARVEHVVTSASPHEKSSHAAEQSLCNRVKHPNKQKRTLPHAPHPTPPHSHLRQLGLTPCTFHFSSRFRCPRLRPADVSVLSSSGFFVCASSFLASIASCILFLLSRRIQSAGCTVLDVKSLAFALRLSTALDLDTNRTTSRF